MEKHPVELVIERADAAIVAEDFDALMEFYADDAILVVRPGRIASGKDEIRAASEAIAAHFDHSLRVEQAGLKVLEADGTALVLARTIVSAADTPPVERQATYVFNRSATGEWLCVIDNSYGHELLDHRE